MLKICLYKAVYHQRPVETFMEARMKKKEKERERKRKKKEKGKEKEKGKGKGNMAHYDVKSNSG